MPPVNVRRFATSTGVTITNPLVQYRALLATKRIDPDPAQHRLALHLQKLYERLKDYEPVVQYGYRLQQISRALGSTPGQPLTQVGAKQKIEDNRGVFSSFLGKDEEKEATALTKVLTDHEKALHLDSPKGLMLHGEVGTGKSMLIDLFADCLPNRKKRRWHFNTFMLETIAKLERLRRSRQMIIPTSLGRQDDYSLLWLARDLISTSPIIFLDEFQLPDRAASKILTNLMTGFFQLGGVLIATSNRMPEELAKAAGMEFTPPPTRMESLSWKLGLSRVDTGKSGKMYQGSAEFAAFLDVLKARCEIWEMEGSKDYRRRDFEDTAPVLNDAEIDDLIHDESFDGLHRMSPGNVGLGYEQSSKTKEETNSPETKPSDALPPNYILATDPSQHDLQILEAESRALANLPAEPWTATTVKVYGREVSVPRQRSGVSRWTFDELCGRPHGPADYITLASTYHTVILEAVPVLSVLQRNEARRFITLLDALYEARCKLVVSAAAGPDDLFFPERTKGTSSSDQETVAQDPVYSETIAEVYQDATAPFRPNISLYQDEPDYTHSRLAGMFSGHPPDALEDSPPNTLQRGDSIYGRDASPGSEFENQGSRSAGPDFSQAGIFTGEDEKFAYKRARSRLWEMCGARWWAREGGVGEDPRRPGWWQPLDPKVRVWENPEGLDAAASAESPFAAAHQAAVAEGSSSGEGMAGAREISREQDEVLFRHNASPFRTHAEPPPKLSWTHVWGMMKWGKKAGAWGQGVDGLRERAREKEGGRAGASESDDEGSPKKK